MKVFFSKETLDEGLLAKFVTDIAYNYSQDIISYVKIRVPFIR